MQVQMNLHITKFHQLGDQHEAVLQTRLVPHKMNTANEYLRQHCHWFVAIFCRMLMCKDSSRQLPACSGLLIARWFVRHLQM